MFPLKKWIGQIVTTGVVIAAMLAIFAGAIRISRTFLGEDGLLVGVLIGGITNALVLHGVQRLAQSVVNKVQKAQQKAELNE